MKPHNWVRGDRKGQKKRRKERIRTLINELKSVPCADCGKFYPPYVMDFDHRDPSDKKYHIGEATRSMSILSVYIEVAKCDVVCANCHRIRTHQIVV